MVFLPTDLYLDSKSYIIPCLFLGSILAQMSSSGEYRHSVCFFEQCHTVLLSLLVASPFSSERGVPLVEIRCAKQPTCLEHLHMTTFHST